MRNGAAALGIHLSLAQMDLFRRYYEEIVAWNARVNLTSVIGWTEVHTRHFLDSLTVSLAIPQPILESGRFVDVGSGAGFPSVPLKIAFPGLRGILVEATAKKADFLVHVTDSLGLSEVEICTGRAETLARDPGLRERFDLALARAVAKLDVLAELTLPFCRIGGIVVAQKARDAAAEIARAQRAIDIMGGELAEVREISVQELGVTRTLVVLKKVSPTPERYPRRPGMPAKRPL